MTEEHTERSGQWPGPPPAAERKAGEVKDNIEGTDRRDHEAVPDRTGTAPTDARPARDPAEGTATLLEPAHTAEFRRRWDAIKASFVDDPQAAVRRAEELADEVVTELTQAVNSRRRELAERGEGADGQDDQARTERLRVVLSGYQSVLDPVLKI
jgi:hypothetical protein